jgi:uncharacterized protein (TIGR02265 family)
VRELTIRVGTRLPGDIDVEAQVALISPEFQVKGMFLSPLVQGLPADMWDELCPRLQSPPRGGRYTAFRDYPQADYMRISTTLARHRFPEVGLREAMRRLARQDFDVFSASTFGKVLLAVVRDARGALLKVPLVYDKVAPGGYTVRGGELDDGTVRIEFENYPHDWAYMVGQLEGVVLHYGTDPVTVVREPTPGHVQFDVQYAS